VIREAAATLERRRDQAHRAYDDVDGHPVASAMAGWCDGPSRTCSENALKYTPAGKDVFCGDLPRDGTVEIESGGSRPGSRSPQGRHVPEVRSVEAKNGGPRKGFGLGLYMVKLVPTTWRIG